MGKIESGEIGEVDPVADSGSSSPALIRYARRAAAVTPRRTARGAGREEDRGISAHLAGQPADPPTGGRLEPSSGHTPDGNPSALEHEAEEEEEEEEAAFTRIHCAAGLQTTEDWIGPAAGRRTWICSQRERRLVKDQILISSGWSET